MRTPSTASAELPLHQLGVMLHSVKRRLKVISQSQHARPAMARTQVQAHVIRCAEELEQLQVALAVEMGRHWQLELEVFDLSDSNP
jgi:hypothetical protein